MKYVLRSGYTFTPGAAGAGTIAFSGVSNFDVRGLLAVINQTRSADVFAVGDPSLGYASVSGSTVTLKADTSGMAAADVLTIIYDDSVAAVALAAKQPAIGTAGSASADVLTVQGISGGVAQPVSLPGKASSFLQTATATATTTASLAIGANANREMMVLKNSKSSTVSLWFSNASTTSTSAAFELAPGESITLDAKIVRGDVYVFTTSGTATFSLFQA